MFQTICLPQNGWLYHTLTHTKRFTTLLQAYVGEPEIYIHPPTNKIPTALQLHPYRSSVLGCSVVLTSLGSLDATTGFYSRHMLLMKSTYSAKTLQI